jgi:cellobiose-specific phosphotransferase system component IIB
MKKTLLACSKGLYSTVLVKKAVFASKYSIGTVMVRSDDIGARSWAENIHNKEVLLKGVHASTETCKVFNYTLATNVDQAIIVWDGKDEETRHLIYCLNTLNKPVKIYIVKLEAFSEATGGGIGV